MRRAIVLRRVVAVVGAAALLAGCAAGVDRAGTRTARPTVLTFADVLHAFEMGPFIDAVSQLSHGRLAVREAPDWHRTSVTAETDLIRAVQRGRVPLAIVPARAFRAIGVRSFDAALAPMAIDSLALEEVVLGSSIGTDMLGAVRAAGVRGLGFLPGPIRYPVGLGRSLLGPDDYQGARVAISPGDVAATTLRSLGASPVDSTFFKDSLTGDDGLEGQVGVVDGNTYDVPGTQITANVPLWPRLMVLIANPQALSTDAANLVELAAQQSIRPVADEVAGGEREARGNVCRRGNARFVSATEDEVAALRLRLAPVYRELRTDPLTADLSARIGDLRRSSADATLAEEPACPEGTGPTDAPRTATPIDGTYRMSSTLRELRAISADQTDVPENYGDWTIVFDRGRLAFTQHDRTACTWGYGRYTVTGSRLVWDMLDGGGQAPTNALNKAGEHFVYAWVQYRDTLVMKAVAGAISPENFRVKAWRRVSRSAEPEALDARCRPPAPALPR